MFRALLALSLLTLAAGAAGAQAWEDPFAGEALDARWTWRVPTAGPTFSLKERPGWLRVTIPQREQGYNHWNNPLADDAPQLRAAAPEGDWELETHLQLQQFDPWSHFQVGLLVGQSDAMLLTWGPLQGPNLPGGPKTPEAWLEPTGSSGFAKAPGEAKDLFLKLVKTGNTLHARLRRGEGEWVEAGAYTLPRAPQFVGIIGKTFAPTPGVIFDVDYLRLTPRAAGAPLEPAGPVQPAPEPPAALQQPVPQQPVPQQPAGPELPLAPGAAPGGGGDPPVAGPARPEGFIVWESGAPGAREIYRSNLDGTDPRPLTPLGQRAMEAGETRALRPRVSPDGLRILFASGPAGKPVESWILPAEGGEAKRLAQGLPLGWIEGGKAFALLRDSQVWRCDPETGRASLLSPARLPLDGKRNDLAADIRPDGKWVAFEAPGGCRCFSLEKGKIARKLEGGSAPRFSADGRFVYWLAGPREIRLWNIAEDWEQQVLTLPAGAEYGDLEYAAVSRDGRWVAYVTSKGDRKEQFIQPLADWQAAGAPARITPVPGCCCVEMWAGMQNEH